MRTATPLVTWSRMTEFDPSATSGVNSTPRLIGPGARMSIPGFDSASRSPFMPNRWAYSRTDGNRPVRCRSNCTRSRLITSHRGRTASRLCAISTPSVAISRGTRVVGPQTMTFAPSLVRPWMLLRATRLWAMSPTRATVSPAIVPRRWRIVKMSRRPCVGCSCAPSPALMTLTRGDRCCVRSFGAPADECRTTTASMPIASMLRAVSMNDSPLAVLDPDGEKSSVSAPSRRQARLKLIFVRVEFSKNRLATTLPASVVNLGDSRPTPRYPAASSSSPVICAAESSSRVSKWVIDCRSVSSRARAGPGCAGRGARRVGR